MKEVEEFRVIPTYEDYMVSNYGSVKSMKYGKERLMKLPKNKEGYPMVNLRSNGKSYVQTVHKLVAMAFLAHKPNGITMVVDHIDGDKSNNKLSNLRVVSNKQNTTSYRKGYYFCKQKNKYHVRTQVNLKDIHIGFYKTEEEAREAYINALDKYGL